MMNIFLVNNWINFCKIIKQSSQKVRRIKRKINGFHHDYLNRLEKSGIVQFFNKKVDKLTGIVKADVKYLDFFKEKATFFPSTWTTEECLLKIQESLKNITEIKFEKGKWEVTGITLEGIEIKNIIEKTGELVTSYPILN